jgi:hypothetical protein
MRMERTDDQRSDQGAAEENYARTTPHVGQEACEERTRSSVCELHGPNAHAKNQKNDQAGPLEARAPATEDVGIPSAGGREPALVIAERENRNPENMPGVEAADLYGAAGLRARAAVVVAEGDAFLPEAVKTVENQHASPRGEALRQYNAEWI